MMRRLLKATIYSKKFRDWSLSIVLLALYSAVFLHLIVTESWLIAALAMVLGPIVIIGVSSFLAWSMVTMEEKLKAWTFKK